jgi:hypothetical protein
LEQGTWTGNINVADAKTMDVSGNFLLVARRTVLRCASSRVRGASTRRRNCPDQRVAADDQ